MNIADIIVIWIAKIAKIAITLSHRGAGATWPGEIALRLRPNILHTYTSKKMTIILVAGTNGKTTTAKMIHTILVKNGKKVARNESGANLDNGLVSTFLKHTTLTGHVTKNTFIFEVDEATLPVILSSVTPDILVLLNLFRDQLDRYGEVDAISEKWLIAFKNLFTSSQTTLKEQRKTTYVINGDDPQLAFLGTKISNLHAEKRKRTQQKPHEIVKEVVFFGLDNPELFLTTMQHATDSIFCPNCGNRLTFGGVYFSHLGKYACGQCGFTHPQVSLTAKDVESPLVGVYNIYNTLAASLVGQVLHIPIEKSQADLVGFKPAFGRMETITYKEKRVQILLSKNPTGFNESLRTIISSNTKGPILFVLNDNIPDGRDISWIYDVDFEMIAKEKRAYIVSGDRAYDLAVRLQYADIPKEQITVVSETEKAVQTAIAVVEEKESLWILPTYSAMLDIRKVLVGRRIL